MNKSQLLSGPSCLTNAADDEPLFVLRANDELAPMLVRYWAANYFESKQLSGRLNEKQRAKYAEAIDLAFRMVEWKKAQEKS